MIIVKKLIKEIVTEAIKAYADAIDLSVLDKLETEHREDDLEGFDQVFYHIQKYIKVSVDNLLIMLFFSVLSSVSYCVLKPGLLDFFSNILH